MRRVDGGLSAVDADESRCRRRGAAGHGPVWQMGPVLLRAKFVLHGGDCYWDWGHNRFP